jgi:hypothetical protein
VPGHGEARETHILLSRKTQQETGETVSVMVEEINRFRPIAVVHVLWHAVWMKRLLVFSALSLAACSSAAERRHVQSMQEVEERVRLPKGSERLDQYARYYANDRDRVVATYIMLVDRENRYYDLPVGQRRWLDDRRNLPAISDGGCSIVNVVYDPKAPSAPEAFCNGVA